MAVDGLTGGLLYYFHSNTGADAGRSRPDHLLGLLQVFDAARCLYTQVASDYPSHQCDIRGCSAALAEAGRRFNEVRAGVLSQSAGCDLLLISQQCRLEDHFSEASGFVSNS